MAKRFSTNGTEPKTAQGITALTVRGFKSLYDECRLEIRPLTILAGANSSGKSSAMQPLLLLKQTLEASYDPGPLLLNGPNVRFTSVDQFLTRIAGKSIAPEFVIRLELDELSSLIHTFAINGAKPLELMQMEYQNNKRESFLLRSDMRPKKIPPEALKDFFPTLSPEEKALFEIRVSRNRCFLQYELRLRGSIIWAQALSDYSEQFDAKLRGIIHVPGLRGNPERNYRTTAVGSTFMGTFENYVAGVIHHWQYNRDARLGVLSNALKLLGVSGSVAAKSVNDTQVELHVSRLLKNGRNKAHDFVSIADVGFGVSQVLPVLVALLVAEPGQLVYLEQPEIHLHPRAQVALAQIIAEAANRGVRVVAETHSALLLLAIQSLVAEGQIESDKVRLHWFQRGDNGMTKIISADLDGSGAFGEWPEDFADVALEAESRYLDLAEARRRKK
ncbi:MAG: AAA family ATPase [candidate division KSB1 bacterium]